MSWRGSQPIDCQASQQRAEPSASDLLQNYIARFERVGPQPQLVPPAPTHTPTGGWWEQPRLQPQPLPPPPPSTAQLSPMVDDDRDTLALLCGRDGGHLSVGTRRILRDIDKQLGHLQPCYSAPDKLDLRTMWPSMHEHLERRWRRQLRARYEARHRAEEEAAAALVAQGSRANLYSWSSGGARYRRTPPAAVQDKVPPATHPVAAAAAPAGATTRWRKEATDDVSDDGTEKADSDGEDNEVDGADDVDDASLAEAALRTAAEGAKGESDESDVEEDLEKGGRPWGSDSGLGLSCAVADDKEQTPLREVASAKTSDPEVEVAGVGEAEEEEPHDSRPSFDERMRSYRCVLEAHELSSQLRQRLEVACACATAAPGGPRALTVDQKGRIRDRLTLLQHPELAGLLAAASTDGPAPSAEIGDRRAPEQPRITTERLTRLMSSARDLLHGTDDRLDSCRRACDSLLLAAAGQEQPQRSPGLRQLQNPEDSC